MVENTGPGECFIQYSAARFSRTWKWITLKMDLLTPETKEEYLSMLMGSANDTSVVEQLGMHALDDETSG
jgi:hypothetical protein